MDVEEIFGDRILVGPIGMVDLNDATVVLMLVRCW